MNAFSKLTVTLLTSAALTLTFSCSSDGSEPPETGVSSSDGSITGNSSSSVTTTGGSSSSINISSSSDDTLSSSSSEVSSSSEISSSSSETPKCNGTEYDPENQRCEANIIETKCGTDWYNAANTDLRCEANIVEGKCGTEWFNVANQRCEANIIETKCGIDWFNAANTNLRCEANTVETKCGTSWYNAENTDLRCKANIVEGKCGTEWFNVTNQRCEANIIETKCGTDWFNAVNTNLRCEANVVETKCGTDWYNTKNQICDTRDYEIYKFVKIGSQTWMAKNLNYEVDGSKCYNCTEYGRLYDWETAMDGSGCTNDALCSPSADTKYQGVCPLGWHLPTQDEWNTLTNYIKTDKGCTNCDAKHLKATSGWNRDGNGLDSYGFAALPGGVGYSGGNFDNVGDFGFWWSASEYDANNTYYRFMAYYDEYAYWDDRNKTYLYSVRCVMD